MKKPLIFGACAVVLALAAAVLLLLSGEDAIAELNENSRLPVPLCTQEAQALETVTESLTYVPGFGEYALDNDDICIYLSGWPDVQDAYHVTRIHLFSSGYHVLGLQVGDSMDKAEQVMAQYGYDRREEAGRLIYTKGDVTVILYGENSLLTRINVSAAVTNKNDIVF